MNTLNINTELLQQAEMQAKMYNLNLNQIVESFIRKFIKNPRGVEQIVIKTTPFVERLGVDLDLPADFDEKKAYQHYIAIQANCDCIITRNVKDFINSDIPVYTPKDFLEKELMNNR